MIPFFRKLRQSLLADNRVAKYLLYAVGEIALVVIGILVALWVDDWNEGRKDQAKKEALLSALSVEFQANLIQLDSVMYYNDRVIDASRKLIEVRHDPARTLPNDTLRAWFQDTGWLWTFDPQTGALRSGISSGDIHLIASDSLINLLFSWQDLVADAAENEKRHIDVQLQSGPVIAPHIRSLDIYKLYYTELPESNFRSDYGALSRDPLFEDYLSELYSHTKDAKNELQLVRRQNSAILRLIEAELNR